MRRNAYTNCQKIEYTQKSTMRKDLKRQDDYALLNDVVSFALNHALRDQDPHVLYYIINNNYYFIRERKNTVKSMVPRNN